LVLDCQFARQPEVEHQVYLNELHGRLAEVWRGQIVPRVVFVDKHGMEVLDDLPAPKHAWVVELGTEGLNFDNERVQALRLRSDVDKKPVILTAGFPWLARELTLVGIVDDGTGTEFSVRDEVKDDRSSEWLRRASHYRGGSGQFPDQNVELDLNTEFLRDPALAPLRKFAAARVGQWFAGWTTTNAVVVTMHSEGAALWLRGASPDISVEFRHIVPPSSREEAVVTWQAGDALRGALVASLAERTRRDGGLTTAAVCDCLRCGVAVASAFCSRWPLDERLNMAVEAYRTWAANQSTEA
jgi:hypothetical protein